MHPNQATLERFYAAFNKKDAAAMAACYHEKAIFDDPVFKNLRGSEVGMMWKMLCRQSSSLEIVAKNIEANEDNGRADWSARYTFGRSQRKVYNQIHAEFTFEGGKIIRHVDEFNFWKWSRMALGPLGAIMGWNSIVKVNIQKQARANLAKFITKAKNT